MTTAAQMIEQMIGKVFATRNAAHVEHWKTKSYAQHQALGAFYDGVIDLLDKLVEAYQGAAGLIGDVVTDDEKSEQIIDRLKDEVVWLEQNKASCCKEISALENIVDEMVALYLSTIYKLENLG